MSTTSISPPSADHGSMIRFVENVDVVRTASGLDGAVEVDAIGEKSEAMLLRRIRGFFCICLVAGHALRNDRALGR